MGDMISTGLSWLAGEREDHMSATITYTRDNVDYEISATVGRTEYTLGDEEGFEVGATAIDFIVSPDALAFTPKRGDTITHDGKTYRVLPLGEDRQGWRYSDGYGTAIRIHAKVSK